MNDNDLERMARLEERLKTVADENPACRQQLKDATEEIKEIRERLTRVEQGHEALKESVEKMDEQLREQFESFKRGVSWAIGTAITISSVLVSALPYILGR